jgi:hypothetical protein
MLGVEHHRVKTIKGFPSREGQGPSGPGVGLWNRERTHPGAPVKASQAFTPSKEGFPWVCKL